MLWECFGLLAVLGFLLYKWSTATFKTFEKRGIPYEKPFPLLGNGKGMLKKDYAVMRSFRELYKRNKQHKIFGFFNMREPIFFIHDPEFIKKLCIKDFEYFVNRNSIFEGSNEPLMENMILNLKDQRWKSMRTTLTPAFTAAKMRSMFTLMQESFDQSLDYLASQSKDGEPFELELKECFSHLSNDIIASTAFGLKVNSYADSENKFFKLGQSITNYKGAMLVKMMLMSTAPWLAKFPNTLLQLLGLKIFNAELTDYFMRLVCDAMKYRKENNIVRPDMIQLLMDAQKEAEQQLDDVNLVAQCFIFFFAAFENNANLISTASMELMYHPDIQQRLYEEVLALHQELNGEQLNYDSVSKIKYMDMVVNEALRKNPLSVMIDRVCSKDYKLYDDENNLVFEFKQGDYLWFPVLGLASDEQYFENPEEFNPERFSDENKQNIRACTHFPFGLGPRSCIGNRYAMMQVKAMLYYLVLNYKLERAEKSPESMYAGIEGFTPVPKNCWIRFVPREMK